MSSLSTIVNSVTAAPKPKQVSTTSNSLAPPPTITTTTPSGPSPAQTTDPKNMVPITADDVKYRRKYKDLKRRIRDIEEDNDVLNIKLSRARKNIHRLRVERSFLFDRLDQTEHGTNGHTSSSSSTSTDSDTDEDRNGHSRSSHHSHGHHTKSHYRHLHTPHSHHSSTNRHHSTSHSLPPPNAAVSLARSKSPPSRASSAKGSTQHSASSSIGNSSSSAQITDAVQTPLPTGGKRAIKKRRKDPLAPKRPSNAFFIFSQQHRQQAREEKKEGNQSELTKFLGQQWKSMPSTEKKIYSELAIQDRQRYIEEMSTYQHENGSGEAGEGPTDKKTTANVPKKKPGKPGRPPKAKALAAQTVAAVKAATPTTMTSVMNTAGLSPPTTNGNAKFNEGLNGNGALTGGEDVSSQDEGDSRMEITEGEDDDEEEDHEEEEEDHEDIGEEEEEEDHDVGEHDEDEEVEDHESSVEIQVNGHHVDLANEKLGPNGMDVEMSGLGSEEDMEEEEVDELQE